MVKIDALIFGYRRLKIDPVDLSVFTSLLIRASIPSVINNDGTLTVRERDFEKTKELMSGRIDFTYSHLSSLPDIKLKHEKKFFAIEKSNT